LGIGVKKSIFKATSWKSKSYSVDPDEFSAEDMNEWETILKRGACHLDYENF
jgi:hypothetical protein